MSSGVQLRRSHALALVGALACGALTAALASGEASPPKLITLKDGPERLVEIKASAGGDSVHMYGTAPGDLTFGADRVFTSERTDCVVTGPAETNAVCSDFDLETVELNLGGGSDEFRIFNDLTSALRRIIIRGGDGADALRGTEFDDELEGGGGPDSLKGLEGRDKLDGGARSDHCNGGPGQDQIKNCE